MWWVELITLPPTHYQEHNADHVHRYFPLASTCPINCCPTSTPRVSMVSLRIWTWGKSLENKYGALSHNMATWWCPHFVLFSSLSTVRSSLTLSFLLLIDAKYSITFGVAITLVVDRDCSHSLFLQTSLWMVLRMTPHRHMNFSGYKPGMEYARTECLSLHIRISNVWMFFRMTAPVHTSLHACVPSHFSRLRLYILQNCTSSGPHPLLPNSLFLLTSSF